MQLPADLTATATVVALPAGVPTSAQGSGSTAAAGPTTFAQMFSSLQGSEGFIEGPPVAGPIGPAAASPDSAQEILSVLGRLLASAANRTTEQVGDSPKANSKATTSTGRAPEPLPHREATDGLANETPAADPLGTETTATLPLGATLSAPPEAVYPMKRKAKTEAEGDHPASDETSRPNLPQLITTETLPPVVVVIPSDAAATSPSISAAVVADPVPPGTSASTVAQVVPAGAASALDPVRNKIRLAPAAEATPFEPQAPTLEISAPPAVAFRATVRATQAAEATGIQANHRRDRSGTPTDSPVPSLVGSPLQSESAAPNEGRPPAESRISAPDAGSQSGHQSENRDDRPATEGAGTAMVPNPTMDGAPKLAASPVASSTPSDEASSRAPEAPPPTGTAETRDVRNDLLSLMWSMPPARRIRIEAETQHAGSIRADIVSRGSEVVVELRGSPAAANELRAELPHLLDRVERAGYDVHSPEPSQNGSHSESGRGDQRATSESNDGAKQQQKRRHQELEIWESLT